MFRHPVAAKFVPSVPGCFRLKETHLVIKHGKAGVRLVPQAALVGFNCQHVVGVLLDNPRRTVLLAPNRVNRDNAAVEVKQGEEAGNGRDFVRGLVYSHLAQDETVVTCPSTD